MSDKAASDLRKIELTEKEQLESKKLKVDLSFLPSTVRLGRPFKNYQKLLKLVKEEATLNLVKQQIHTCFTLIELHVSDKGAFYEEAALIMEQGTIKYSLEGWKTLAPLTFCKALLRHELSRQTRSSKDEESGHSHKAHCLCNLLIIEALLDE